MELQNLRHVQKAINPEHCHVSPYKPDKPGFKSDAPRPWKHQERKQWICQWGWDSTVAEKTYIEQPCQRNLQNWALNLCQSLFRPARRVCLGIKYHGYHSTPKSTASQWIFTIIFPLFQWSFGHLGGKNGCYNGIPLQWWCLTKVLLRDVLSKIGVLSAIRTLGKDWMFQWWGTLKYMILFNITWYDMI